MNSFSLHSTFAQCSKLQTVCCILDFPWFPSAGRHDLEIREWRECWLLTVGPWRQGPGLPNCRAGSEPTHRVSWIRSLSTCPPCYCSSSLSTASIRCYMACQLSALRLKPHGVITLECCWPPSVLWLPWLKSHLEFRLLT